MKTLLNRLPSFLFVFGLSIAFFPNAQAQVIVGLDHYFNREIHKQTGQPFHYLWADTAFSGYSQWGELFTQRGASLSLVEQAPDAAVLKNTGIYIIVDPDTTSENPNPNYVTPKDADAIVKWVASGGVLLLLSNDAPNAEFTHFNQLAGRFGLHFNHVSVKPVKGREWNMGAITQFPDHPLFKGVKKIYMKELSTLKLSGKAKPVLTENGQVLMAETAYGKGHVLAISDPWIYNEYIDHALLPADFHNKQAAINLTEYLFKLAKTRPTNATDGKGK